MISSKEMCMDQRVRYEMAKNRLKKTLPPEGYLTLRKDELLRMETEPRKKKVK